MYRELQEQDLSQIAAYKLANDQLESPYWCKTNQNWMAESVQSMIDSYARRGEVLSYCHEENGKLVSCFVAWHHNTNLTWFIGVVDLSLLDYERVWRADVDKAFQESLELGVETIRIKLNLSHCRISEWMENEIGMRRHLVFPMWKCSREEMEHYLEGANAGAT